MGDDRVEFLAVVGDAAAAAAEGEGGADDGRQAELGEGCARLVEGGGGGALRAFEPDAADGVAEQLTVLGFADGLARGADHLDTVFGQGARVGERHCDVERGLPAHGREQGVGPLALDDLGHELGRDRLDIGRIREAWVGHDRRRVRVDENDAVALVLERPARLGAGIIKLARLPDHDRPGANNQNRFDVGALRHGHRPPIARGG